MLPYRPRKDTLRIILHDSHGVPTVPALLTQGRRMGILSTGYHYMVDRLGRVHRGRPHGAIGCHTPGHNHNSIGVCLIRGPSASDYDESQREGLRLLLVYLHGEFPNATLHGHNELVRHRGKQACDCPLNINMEDLRRDLKMQQEVDAKPVVAEQSGDLSFQNKLILGYLQGRGPLSNQTAIIELGIGSLTSRIAELRKRGYPITDEVCEDFHGHRYKKYNLAKAEEANVVS